MATIPELTQELDDLHPGFRFQWGRAGRALLEVLKDTSRSDKVAEMVFSLEGDGIEKGFRRFRKTEFGQKVLREKPSLLGYLTEMRPKFRDFPKDTFGYAYAMYMDQDRLDGQVLAEATARCYRDDDPQLKVDGDRQYFRDRMRDMHDLWHPLTGYGADELGEAALLCFTYAQMPVFGIAALASMAFLFAPLAMPNDGWGFRPFLLDAWQRGRNAEWLIGEHIEEMLALPLDAVRTRLKIAPVSVAHPKGIYEWSRNRPRVRLLKAA